DLSPIIVFGEHMPFVAALQMYKKALTRHWSTDPATRDELVCHWNTPVGTHLQYLYCATNRMHLRQHRQIGTMVQGIPVVQDSKHGRSSSMQRALRQARIPMQLVAVAHKEKFSRSSLEPMLAKLPPAGSSYTVRVKGDNGKPL